MADQRARYPAAQMSDLAAAAVAIGAPEELVQRSADARAAASGGSAVEILAAWAGGAPVSVPTATTDVIVQTDPAPAEQATAEQATAEQATAEQTNPAPAPAAVEASPSADVIAPRPAVALLEVEDEDPVEASQLGDRLRSGGRVGALLGLLAGVLVALFSVQWLLPRVGVLGEEGAFELVFDAVPGWLIAGSALVGIPLGLAIATISRTLLSLRAPGMRLVSSSVITAIVGGATGGILGAAVGAIVLGAGEPSALDPEITAVPVLAGLIWLLFGWVVSGWIVVSVSQMIGVPAGVTAEQSEEGDSVRHRLVSAFGIPAMAAMTIALVVLPVAWVFIQFPGYAPLVGIFISAGIVAFAGLSASRPGMRISTGEFFAAFAGIGIIVLILVSVLFVQGAGHGEDEGSTAESAEEAEAVVVTFLV